MLRALSVFLLWCWLPSPMVAGEQLTTQQAHSEAHLVASRTALVPGETITFALQIKLEPGWHVYWRNPGDSAAAPIVEPKLPAGYQASDLKYGVPKRIPVPPLMSFGYEEQTYYGIDVQVPASESDALGQIRTFVFASEWLVCKEECIPAFFDFVIELPIALQAEPTEHAVAMARALDAVDRESPLPAVFRRNGDQVMISVPERAGRLVDVFPFPNMPLTNVDRKISGQEVGLTWNAISNPPGELALLGVWEVDGVHSGQTITAQAMAPSLWSMFGFAIIGGLILNLMPCVFPVLVLKLMAVVKSREQSQRGVVASAFAYQAGILVCMWGFALVLLLAREAGEAFGWGFQLQSPWFVASLAILFFLIGLNFIGAFDFHLPFAGSGQALTEKDGWVGSFFTGVLAVVVASPCTAPFMGVAIGYALSQSAGISFMVFGGLGLGLGLPYLILGLWPKLTRLLPRPGTWMVTLKELMAFPIWGTVIWLLFVYQQQQGALPMMGVLVSLLLLAMVIWGWRKFARLGRAALVVVTVILLAANLYLTHPAGVSVANATVDSEWGQYSKDELAQLRANGQPVFVNFTAAWCISCQVNDQTTFKNAGVQAFVAERGIAMLKADYTNHDDEITATLQAYDRAGVPLYLYFPVSSDQAVVLPEVLTPQIFKTYIEDNS